MKLPCHKPAQFVRPFRQKLVADADVVKLQDLHLYVQQLDMQRHSMLLAWRESFPPVDRRWLCALSR